MLNVSRFRMYTCRHFVTTSSSDIETVFHDVGKQIMSGRGSFSQQLQSIQYHINNGGQISPNQATIAIKACGEDIIDIVDISQQQSITQSLWKSLSHRFENERTSVHLYNAALHTFYFQRLCINEDVLLKNVLSNCQPNQETYRHHIKHLCRQGDDTEAQNLAEEHDLWCPEVAGHVISAQIRKGRMKATNDVLQRIGVKEAMLSMPLQNKEHLSDRLMIAGGFLIGSAGSGDLDLLKLYLHKFNYGFKELLKALVELCRVSPNNYKTIIHQITGGKSRKVGHTLHLSKMVRRPVKELLSLNQYQPALDLVAATREHRKPQSYQSMKYRSPVILLEHQLKTSKDVGQTWDVLEELELADPAIKVKALALLYEMQYNTAKPVNFYRDLAKRIQDGHYRDIGNARELRYLTELMNEKCREVGRDEVKLLNILTTGCSLGIRIPAFYPVWRSLLSGLMPIDKYNTCSELVSRSFQVKEMLDVLIKNEPGYYSNTMVWGFIMQYLVSRETDLTFETAATLTKKLKVVYAPGRWHHNLGKCLFKTKLISTYIDILKVSHSSYVKNRRFQQEFYAVCDSLLVTLERSAEENLNNDELLIDIFTHSWNSGVLFPRRVKGTVSFITK